MSHGEFVAVTTVDAVPEGGFVCVKADGMPVLVCRLGEAYYAVRNKCTHANARFDRGRLEGHRLSCPVHGAEFDVRDGKVLSPPAFQPLDVLPVKVEDGVVYVRVDGAAPASPF